MKKSMFLVRFALIVGKLKVGRPMTAKELADYVNSDNRINGAGKVSVRTIQRDIAELRDGLGMNIVNKNNNTYAIEPMKEYCPEHIKNLIDVIYEILKGFEKTEPEKLVLNTAINQSKDVKISLLTEENKCIDIDADLNAGAISFDEAKRRRTILWLEADFYQTLDRVCEFLNRYFIASIILTLINLLGGIIIEVY